MTGDEDDASAGPEPTPMHVSRRLVIKVGRAFSTLALVLFSMAAMQSGLSLAFALGMRTSDGRSHCARLPHLAVSPCSAPGTVLVAVVVLSPLVVVPAGVLRAGFGAARGMTRLRQWVWVVTAAMAGIGLPFGLVTVLHW